MADWTEARVEDLRRLWGEGKSASEIAEVLGGISRNAVIGKAHRIGLDARRPGTPKVARRPGAAIGKDKPRVIRATPPTPGAPRLPLARRLRPPAAPARLTPSAPPTPPTCAPVTLMARTALQCAWPLGMMHEPATLFCGAAIKPTDPFDWCEYHSDLGFQSSEQRRRSAARHPGGVEAMIGRVG